MRDRQSSYQAEWSLLMGGIAQARLEAHRIRHLLQRARDLVDRSEQKEAIYQAAGDILQALPTRWTRMENHLDRTAYGLMVLGEGNFRDRLPMDDRAVVDGGLHKGKSLMATRVAARWLSGRYTPLPQDMSGWLPGQVHKEAEDPQLGWPGGPCHLVHRIHYRVRNPDLRERLTEQVEWAGKLDKADERKVYDPIRIPGIGSLRDIELVPHAQHRMDQRSIIQNDIRLTLRDWLKKWAQGKSLAGQPVRKPKLKKLLQQFEAWNQEIRWRQPIEYLDPQTNIFLVFLVGLDSRGTPVAAKVVTAYWRGVSDPRPPGGGTCPA